MKKKSLFNDVVGKIQSNFVKQQPAKKAPSVEGEAEVDHLWMAQDNSQIIKKPVTKKDPRIDTGILQDRIKEKLTKLGSN